MTRACAAFGPNGSYLFSTDIQWRCKDIPSEVLTLFSGANKAKEIYEIALGPNGSYAVTFADRMGVQKFMHEGIPEDLRKWVCGPGRDLETLNIALGADNAFFAFDATGAIWDELPEHFEQQMKSLLNPTGGWKYGKNPVSVSFGARGSYVMIVQDGCAGFMLDDDYPAAIKKYLLNNQYFALKGKTIILNPSSIGTYMILDGDGGAEGAFPSDCVAHFQAFSEEWKVLCKNAQIDATNAMLKGTGVSIPRVSIPSNSQNTTSGISNASYPHYQYQHHANHAPNPYAQQALPDEAPPPYSAHSFTSHVRPTVHALHALHQMSNSGTNGGSSSANVGGGSTGSSGGTDIINNLISVSNNGTGTYSSGGNSNADMLNQILSSSNGGNSNADMINQIINASNPGNTGFGGFGPVKNVLNNAGSGVPFDPTGGIADLATSFMTTGFFS